MLIRWMLISVATLHTRFLTYSGRMHWRHTSIYKVLGIGDRFISITLNKKYGTLLYSMWVDGDDERLYSADIKKCQLSLQLEIHFYSFNPYTFYIMAKANKFYTFLIMCTGMAAGSTAVNKVNSLKRKKKS